jgi:hypothetical protein
MASLFTALGRIMSGKPVFDSNDTSPSQADGQAPNDQAPATPGAPASAVRKGDANTYPVVEVRRVETRVDGNTMQVYCYIRNSSPELLVLDKIQLLGLTKRLGDDLRPNEYLTYSGPALQNDQYREALVDYKTASGDYFEALYEVIFSFHQENKTYTVGELRLRPPIRDIYG